MNLPTNAHVEDEFIDVVVVAVVVVVFCCGGTEAVAETPSATGLSGSCIVVAPKQWPKLLLRRAIMEDASKQWPKLLLRRASMDMASKQWPKLLLRRS
jgi:hypothetical protein